MTDFLSRIRDIALLLPGVEERDEGGRTIFTVDGKSFIRVDTGTPASAGVLDEAGWQTIEHHADSDWTDIEDRIARSWELTAPRALLEAGGR